MNYTDIAPLESAGLSDEQIAAVLSSVTVRPVPLQQFENFLDDNDLGTRENGNLLTGPIYDIADIEGHPLQGGVKKLRSHVLKQRSEQIDTSIADVTLLIGQSQFVNGDWERQPWCLMAAELLAGLIQASIITEQHREGFYALGGGLKHGPVTVGQIDELRTQHQFQSRVTNATALFAERMKTGDDPAVVMAQAWEDAV